jgi:hypothetical protein
VVIIGAPRSGTNALRDVLTSLSGFVSWPCDEINYVWRHGNARHPDDELAPEQARPAVRRYVRRRFHRLSRRRRAARVVEKTCANSLRVAFVDRILPEARFLFLVRDGRDATASAMRLWRAGIDIGYLARKARFVPGTDLPYYALRFVTHRMRQAISRERRLPTWGPRFPGLDTRLREDGLAVACAAQWSRCVGRAHAELAALPQERVLRLRYESFVEDPGAELVRIAGWLGVDVPAETVHRTIAPVTSAHRGRWRERLTAAEIAKVAPILDPVLAQQGYA